MASPGCTGWHFGARFSAYCHAHGSSNCEGVGAITFKLESGSVVRRCLLSSSAAASEIVARKCLLSSSGAAAEMPFRLECGSIAQKCLQRLRYIITREQVEQRKTNFCAFRLGPSRFGSFGRSGHFVQRVVAHFLARASLVFETWTPESPK